jgi:hypothetical protein
MPDPRAPARLIRNCQPTIPDLSGPTSSCASESGTRCVELFRVCAVLARPIVHWFSELVHQNAGSRAWRADRDDRVLSSRSARRSSAHRRNLPAPRDFEHTWRTSRGTQLTAVSPACIMSAAAQASALAELHKAIKREDHKAVLAAANKGSCSQQRFPAARDAMRMATCSVTVKTAPDLTH